MLLFLPSIVLLLTLTAPSTTRSAKDQEAAALKNAAAALSRECEAVLRDPEQPIRVRCDYFNEKNNDPSITPAGVIAVLERPPGRADVRVVSYVKWQLLSAIEGPLDASLAARAIGAYRKSPPLMLRPGISDADKVEMDRLARSHVDTERDAIETKLVDSIGRFNQYNGMILKYRSELYSRLPVTRDSLLAGFDDAASRLAAGIDELDVRPLVERLVADTRGFLATDPPADELKELDKTVSKLAAAKGPVYYDEIRWRESARRLVWSTRQRDLNFNRELQKLAQEISEQRLNVRSHS